MAILPLLKRSMTKQKPTTHASGCMHGCCSNMEKQRKGTGRQTKVMEQVEKAVEIAEIKYPLTDGWRHVWIFDHSSCHGAMAEDSLDVNKMNVNPGGKQRVMRDGFWNGKPQKMNYALGVPKGLRAVLEERGVNTKGMNAEEMREILGSHPDFRDEKSRVEKFLSEKRDRE